MSGKKSQDKGKRFEREVVRWFKAKGFDAKRTAPMQAGDSDFADVLVRRYVCRDPELDDHEWVDEYSVECKCRKDVPKTIYDWIGQAESGPGAPVSIVKRDGCPPLVVQYLKDWRP